MVHQIMRRLSVAVAVAALSVGLLGGCIIRDDNDHGRDRGYVKNSNSYWQGRKDQRYNDRHRGWWGGN